MPVTRSQGKAPEERVVEASREHPPAIRHQLPPRSPSTIEGAESARPPQAAGGNNTPTLTLIPLERVEVEPVATSSARRGTRIEKDYSDRTMKPTDKSMPMTTRGDARQEYQRPPSNKTNRSNRKAMKAREDLLKIKLELAQLALQRAEEESDDGYIDDRISNDEYVRSWLEEAPEPERFRSRKEDIAAEGDDLPPPAESENIVNLQLTGPSMKPSDEKNTVPSKQIEDSKAEDSLRPFITELTSAIASLADKKIGPWTPSNPSASKVIMTLPNFSGAHTEWLSFRAIYETTRGYFNDVENTARLRRSLRGRALETVSSELIGHARPDDIMRELELQFGRPDSIAQAETDRLRGLPRCSETPKDICTFASRVRSGIVTLRALKKEHYLMNAELMRVLTEKLPNSLRVQWYRTYTEKYNSVPNLTLFSDYITEQARFCSAFAPPENISAADGPVQRRATQRTHTATDRPAAKCRLCDKSGHYASDCAKFKEASPEKRWELAKAQHMCFRCLRTRRYGHTCKPKKCGEKGCPATHHRLLHGSKKPAAEQSDKPETPTVNNSTQETVASSRATSSHAYLKIVPVRVIGPAGELPTYALLDDGSTVSLIDEDVAKQIGARGRVDPLKIGAIGNTMIDTPGSRRVTVTLASRGDSRVPFRARTIPKLDLAPQTVSEEDISRCSHLQDIREQLIYNTGAPKILIGQDNWHLLLASEVRRGPQHQPVASLTSVGWTLHGAHTRTLGQQVNYVNGLTNADQKLEQQLREFFALESLIVNPRRPDSDPEKQAEDILSKNTVQLEDGHIETAMLWKDSRIEMPDSYETAIKRLVSIEKKLDSKPALRDRYIEQIDALVKKGYAEKAPSTTTPGRTWYLPHFDVFNPMKPDKLRIVHDAAAKSRGMSLNDFLLTGPDLLQSLPGVMMRFRRHNIAVSSDIAEMFMQVKVRREDRDALRYLWRGNRREGAPEEYRMTSIIFGAASSPCMAIFAKNWNARRYAAEYPEAVEAIVENHYMDDYLDSYRTLEEATRIATAVRDIHRKARFELGKWVSNSTELIENIEPTRGTTEVVNIGHSDNIEKILGLIWKPQSDVLSFNLTLARLPSSILEKGTPTKREALKIVMSLYDPLGLASPVTIRAKQILQEAWRRGVDWDQPFDSDLATQWTSWIPHLKKLKDVSVPRCYPGYSEATETQVHVFTDASEVAYAAAVYWRTTTEDGATHVSLVMAKAKVAPLKLHSIPRLELQAAVMGTRVAVAVIREHKIEPASVTYWSDSKTVLTWIRRGARVYKPFVAHRIAAIEDGSKVDDWRWIPTKQNVADLATRDVPHDLHSTHEWYNGPRFLYEEPSSWPTEKPLTDEPTGEERTLVTIDSTDDRVLTEVVPDSARFSKWERLLRATAGVLHFITQCRKRREKTYYKRTKKGADSDPDWRKQAPRIVAPPTAPRKSRVAERLDIEAEHLKQAERMLVQIVQREVFAQERANLKENREISKDSRLRPLRIEISDDVIRLSSRIDAVSGIEEEVKRPPILHGDHRITQLYIDWTHRSLQHSGTELTVNEVRQHYWVVKLRPTTKMVVSRCLQCRIRKAQPPVPATGDHPRTRLAHHQRPFTFTGLDYFGPLSVTVGRQHQKRYVALFTCLTTRAVHLEIASSLSADSAILALRRFIARRGCPTEIHSDNGTNMHGADKELRDASKEEASRRGVVWRFITPSAPFMGGAWERLVRCVKSALYNVLQEKHPHEEVLSTLLCEAEYTVNSRPLTHVSVDSEDDEAITPNHFLLGGSARVPSPGEFTEQDIDSKKHWRRSQILADMFWRRWVREYLPELQYRREPQSRGPSLQVDDPVLIADGQLPRNTWPRGRIVAVFPGADGEVRTAEVRTAGGTLKRPVKKLIPLPK